MEKLRITPVILLKGHVRDLAVACDRNGADAILFVDESATDTEKDLAIDEIRRVRTSLRAKLIVTGRIRRFEDIKKYLYAGADEVWADSSDPQNEDAFTEASLRFTDKKLLRIPVNRFPAAANDTASVLDYVRRFADDGSRSILLTAQENADYNALRTFLLQNDVPCEEYLPAIKWEELKKGPDGLVPCITQDYRTGEVLMMAWMDESAYNETVSGGRMCYYSRSRKARWLKGETSGHFQFVKSLYADCDRDTLLAKVEQIGAACHTGAHSCFFDEVSVRVPEAKNPAKILEQIYAVALDRKAHPKEGSYTNYLFDKGIDKILKKCGEEAAEIIIAAKNPDPEEIKYEIADFLYHVTVLMVEKGVTWEDISEELARR